MAFCTDSYSTNLQAVIKQAEISQPRQNQAYRSCRDVNVDSLLIWSFLPVTPARMLGSGLIVWRDGPKQTS